MNLVKHVATADIRRFGWIIAAYVCVLVLSTAIDVTQPFAVRTFRVPASWSLASTLLWLAVQLLSVLLVVQIVHADALVGSDAFWMTRPIAPRVLLMSKLFLIALLMIVIPAACELAFMTVFRVPPEDMMRALLQMSLTLTLWTVALMVPASLTRTLGSFVLVCGSVIVVVAIGFPIATAIISEVVAGGVVTVAHFGGGAGLPVMSSSAPDPTALIVTMVFASAAGLAVLAVQYRQRARARAVAVSLAGIVLATVAGSVWPFPIFRARFSVPDWARADDALRLSLEPSSVSFESDRPFGIGDLRWRQAHARIRIGGVALGWRAFVRHAGASLELESGTALEGLAGGYAAQVPLESGEEQNGTVLRSVLGVNRIGGLVPPYPGGERAVVMAIRETDFRANRDAVGIYSGSFEIGLSRDEHAAALPIRQGASYQHEADRFVIDEVRPEDGGVTIRVRRSRVDTMFDGTPPVAYSYYLRNLAREEATVPSTHVVMPDFSLPFVYGVVRSARSSGFMVRQEILSRSAVSPRAYVNDLVIDDDWIAGAELVIVRTSREGSVRRTLTIPGFRLASITQRTGSVPDNDRHRATE